MAALYRNEPAYVMEYLPSQCSGAHALANAHSLSRAFTLGIHKINVQAKIIAKSPTL